MRVLDGRGAAMACLLSAVAMMRQDTTRVSCLTCVRSPSKCLPGFAGDLVQINQSTAAKVLLAGGCHADLVQHAGGRGIGRVGGGDHPLKVVLAETDIEELGSGLRGVGAAPHRRIEHVVDLD